MGLTKKRVFLLGYCLIFIIFWFDLVIKAIIALQRLKVKVSIILKGAMLRRGDMLLLLLLLLFLLLSARRGRVHLRKRCCGLQRRHASRLLTHSRLEASAVACFAAIVVLCYLREVKVAFV